MKNRSAGKGLVLVGFQPTSRSTSTCSPSRRTRMLHEYRFRHADICVHCSTLKGRAIDTGNAQQSANLLKSRRKDENSCIVWRWYEKNSIVEYGIEPAVVVKALPFLHGARNMSRRLPRRREGLSTLRCELEMYNLLTLQARVKVVA